MDENICVICQDNFDDDVQWLVCCHKFCRICISVYFDMLKRRNKKETCPICKYNNDENEMLENVKKLSFDEYESQCQNSNIITFGKYKGKRFDWVYNNDRGYCNWCVSSVNSGLNTNDNFDMFANFVNENMTND